MQKVETTEMTPEIASERYIELEKEYIRYGQLSKEARSVKKKEMYAKRRKGIRTQQNMLYKLIAEGGFVRHTQRVLGHVDDQTLYKRYRRFTGEE